MNTLVEVTRPDVIFAESVGSCADLVATVVKPMLQLQHSTIKPTSFSTFVDVRLLRMWLNDIPLPFSEGVVYIFEKQIEETKLLVVNKMDLLPDKQRSEILDQIRAVYPDKLILPQESLSEDGVHAWLDIVEAGKIPLPDNSLDIDYRIYGEGEARLGWLDEELELIVQDGRGRETAVAVMQAILDELQRSGAAIGHVKFVLRGEISGEAKVSFTTDPPLGWEGEIPALIGEKVSMLINARVELPVERLGRFFSNAIEGKARKLGLTWSKGNSESFHPSFPNPTYRVG